MGGEATDAEVIAASLDDAAAFTDVFERHYQSIFRYVARRIGVDAAGDVAAEVFARAFESRHKYDQRRPSCRPWLYGIASNLVRDHLRHRKRTTRAYLRAAGLEAADVTAIGEAEDRAAAALMLPEINAALAKLSKGDREVLLLYALGELSYEEIAGALGIPIGTVRSRLNRARRRMSELVG